MSFRVLVFVFVVEIFNVAVAVIAATVVIRTRPYTRHESLLEALFDHPTEGLTDGPTDGRTDGHTLF